MVRLDEVEAYILHGRDYQESSLIIELFTRKHGRLSAIAKGVRRPKSKSRAWLQPFVPILVSCAGRGELLALKESESTAPPHFLQGQALISGFYLNELLMRLMSRFDPHPEFFQIYHETLSLLEKHVTHLTSNLQKILRLFEKSLLKAIGYELQLTREVESGHPLDPNLEYFFHPERGPTRVRQSASSQLKENVFSGTSLLAIAEENLEDHQILQDAKRLMRNALKLHLGDRRIESRRLIK